MLLSTRRFPRHLLAVFAAASALLVIIANWSGVGWSWDSTDYVSAGRAISHSLGPLDVTAQPMTVRTPGYPALIAIGEVFRLPINFTLVGINVLSASIITACTFLILHKSTRPTTAIVATLFVLFNSSLLWQYTMAWSEPPFIAVLMAAMVVSLYIQHPAKYAVLALLFTALFFLRFVGPVFAAPIAAIGILADARTRGWFKASIGNSVALLASLLPMWWWLARNYRIDGTFSGARIPGGGTFLDALFNGFATIGTFFSAQPFDSVVYMNWLAYPIAARVAFVAVAISGFLAATFLLIKRHNTFRSEAAIALTMSSLVVVSYLIFSAYRFVHLELGRLDTRMMVPVLIPAVIALAVLLDRSTSNSRTLATIALALTCIFLIANTAITTRDTAKFATSSRHSSTTENNDTPLFTFVRSLPSSSGFFSNAPQRLAPFVESWPIFTQFQLDTTRPVSCTNRFAVWFKDFVVQDNIPNMTPVLYEDAVGVVYDLGPCNVDINTIWD